MIPRTWAYWSLLPLGSVVRLLGIVTPLPVGTNRTLMSRWKMKVPAPESLASRCTVCSPAVTGTTALAEPVLRSADPAASEQIW